MRHRDLNRLYFGTQRKSLFAVGWLEPGHEYPRGIVLIDFVERLRQLLQDPWTPIRFCGRQLCGFCESEDSYSANYLFIPWKGVAYASPEGILHYVEAHSYRPPDVFVEAVLRCPPADSLLSRGWSLRASSRAPQRVS